MGEDATKRSLQDLPPEREQDVKGGEALLIAFSSGTPRAPYVIGGLWSSKDKPPQ